MRPDSEDPMYREWVEQLIGAIDCPLCGAKAARMQIVSAPPYGIYVQPTYWCDTPDCPNNQYDGEHAWTLALTS